MDNEPQRLDVKFLKETDLCAAFIDALPEGWTAYPETGGFDILLSRDKDGLQIGVEAKLKLNAKVICQIAQDIQHYYTLYPAPDMRAILVPAETGRDLAGVCQLLGITVIGLKHPSCPTWRDTYNRFHPYLPGQHSRTDWDIQHGDRWPEVFPIARIALPDYIPDTKSGDKSPVMLTPWKVGAIKLAVLLAKTGYLTRQDFAKLEISMSRWTQNGLLAWLRPCPSVKGHWVEGRKLPDFAAQHPVNFGQIEADFEKWNPRAVKADAP